MTNAIFSMFAKSPFRPLQEHMDKVYECCAELEPFFEAMVAGDLTKAAAVQENISRLEAEADVFKRNIRLNLPDGLFMPVPRTDLLDLLVKQDHLANRAEDISGLMLGRKMVIPERLQISIPQFVRASIQACAKAQGAICELDELVETGFRGHEAELVEKLIFELDAAEGDADVLEREVRAQLFAFEAEMSAVEVMFLYKIIDWIGDVADRAKEIGHRMHLMLAR